VERPESVRSLVLIATFAREVKLNPIMGFLYWFMLNNPWRVQTWRMFYKSLYPTRKPDDFGEYLDKLTANFSEPGRFDALKSFPSSSRQPWAERLPQLDVPTLVMMGSKDPDFPDPVAEAQWLADQTRGKVVMIEGAGHYPQTEMPDQTAQAILSFLQKQ
jgi:pimeloyl-ACP methyl ester carboxylesterase